MPVNCSAPRNQASAVKVQVANPRNTCYTMPCHVLRAPVFFHHEMLCNCVTDRINAWWFRHLWWCIPWRCRRVFCSASKSNLGSASFPQNFAHAKWCCFFEYKKPYKTHNSHFFPQHPQDERCAWGKWAPWKKTPGDLDMKEMIHMFDQSLQKMW